MVEPSQQKTESDFSWKLIALQTLLLGALVAVCFYPSIDNPPWDDTSLFIMYFPSIHHSLETIFSPATYPQEYRPLIHFFNAGIYSISGRNFTTYHLIRILLHFINVLLVYKFASLFLKSSWHRFFAAAIFAIHPASGIRVVEIGPSSFLLLFSMLSFFAYARALREVPRAKIFYVLSIFCFAVGIWMREELYYLIFVLPLYDWMFHEKKVRKIVLRQAPFWLVGVAYVLFKLQIEVVFKQGGWMPYGPGIHMITNLLDYMAAAFFPLIHHVPKEALLNVLDFDPSSFFIVNYPGQLWPNDILHIFARAIAIALVAYCLVRGSKNLRFCAAWVVLALTVFLPLKENCSASYLDQSMIAFGVMFILLVEKLLSYFRSQTKLQFVGRATFVVSCVFVLFLAVQLLRVEPLWEVEGIGELYQTEGRWQQYEIGPVNDVSDLDRLKKELTELYYRDEGKWPVGVDPYSKEPVIYP